MKRTRMPSKTKFPLRKGPRPPIAGVRLMQISSISISNSLPLEKTKSSPAPKASTDTAVINFSASSFSGLVKQASQMPEVRSEVVDSFKSRIQSGQYPTEETMDHLVDTLGASIVKMVHASDEE